MKTAERVTSYPPSVPNVAVSGTGLSAGNANVYADGSWARAGATLLASGTNSYTAIAEDTYGRTAQDSVSVHPVRCFCPWPSVGVTRRNALRSWRRLEGLSHGVNLPATVTFTYDANGNLTGDGRRMFEYDYENQLTNVYVASAWRESMRYDAFGRKRVLQQHHWTASAWLLTNEVRYVYDGMLVVQERHFQPQVSTNIPINTISHTRGNDLSGTRQGAGGIGGLLARTDSSSIQNPASSPHAYYHADGNGNITALVNTNGAVVARYQYDPYGNLLGMAGPLAEANTYRFSSKEWHANAGLYYYGFRYYEPNLQRWLNRDPLEEGGGINLYGFVFNDPVNFADLDGLWGVKIGGINFGWGDPTYVFDGEIDWEGYWGEVGDTLVGEIKGAAAELSLGFYTPCYTSALQKQGGYVGTGLAMVGETVAGGAAGWKMAGKAVKGTKTGVPGATTWSHSIPASKLPGGRDGGLDKFLNKYKLNGNYVSAKRHYKHDNDYWPQYMKKDQTLKEFGNKWNPALQALDRIPRFPAGVAVGAGYAAFGLEGSTTGNGPCY